MLHEFRFKDNSKMIQIKGQLKSYLSWYLCVSILQRNQYMVNGIGVKKETQK